MYSDNLDGSQGHYAEWKKPLPKGHILYDSISITFPKWQNYREEKQFIMIKAWGQCGEGSGCDYKMIAKERSLYIDCSGSYTNLHMWYSDIKLYTHDVPISISWFWFCTIMK